MMTRWFARDGRAPFSLGIADKTPLGMLAGIAMYSFIVIAGVLSLGTRTHMGATNPSQALLYEYGLSGNIGLMVFTTLCVFAFAAPFLLAMLWSIPAAIVLLVMKHYHYHFHTISRERPVQDYSWHVAHS